MLIPDAPSELPLIVLAALLIDLVVGDPPWLARIVPHPVAALGSLVARAERRLNSAHHGAWRRIGAGALLTAALVALAAVLGYALSGLLASIPGGAWLEALIASTLIAYRGLFDAVAAVREGLATSLSEGRAAVRHIVGRDPNALDEAGVVRAAIESLAENFSDGVVAPVFWYLLLGLPGLAAYKAINTLDSMLGHRDERHEAFGKAPARLDDAANILPARLSAFVLLVATAFLPRASLRGAARAVLRDARRHRSPNAGWPEAAFAGALGLRLAGPRRYGPAEVADAWMGDGTPQATAGDIRRALRLYLAAGGVVIGILLILGVCLSSD